MSIDLWPPLALCDPQGPWAYLFTSESASGQAFNLLHQRHGTVVRRVRGHRCRTKQTLLAEWARAFAFPPYFGHNWDAFEECLTDLDWLPAQCYIAIVSDTRDVLPQDDASFATFVELLGHVATEWATPQQGERTHRQLRFAFSSIPLQRNRCEFARVCGASELIQLIYRYAIRSAAANARILVRWGELRVPLWAVAGAPGCSDKRLPGV